MTAPTDVKELHKFLGLANYLGRFTPNLATVSALLRDVCKTNVPYDWGPKHDAAFSNLKKAISSNEVLRYYDSTQPIVIQVAVSQRGLGAALLQASCPIAVVIKGALYRIKILCRRYTFWSYPAEVTIADPPG